MRSALRTPLAYFASFTPAPACCGTDLRDIRFLLLLFAYFHPPFRLSALIFKMCL